MPKLILYFFAFILIVSGIGHLFYPKISDGFIPEFFLPRNVVQILAFVVELAIGVGLLIPALRGYAAWGVLVLMIGFLPLHVIDAFRATPIIGSPTAAVVRLVVQLLFIYLAWRLVQWFPVVG